MAQTRLGRLHDLTSSAALWLALVSLAGIVALGFAGTFSRYLFNAPIGWVPDWTGYLLAACVFLAAPAVTRHQMHISMNLFEAAVGGARAVRWVRLVAGTLTLLIVGVLAWLLLDAAISTYRSGTTTAAGYPIPRWWLFAILFYGVASSGLHMLRDFSDLALGPARSETPRKEPGKGPS